MAARVCSKTDYLRQPDDSAVPLLGNEFGRSATLRKAQIDWKALKKGYELIDTLYPKSDTALNQFARMAALAGDKETAKKLFGRIGDRHDLTVSTTPGGSVSSADGGIGCGGDCVEQYDWGTVVTLTAAPDSGCSFTGWTGGPACEGVPPAQSGLAAEHVGHGDHSAGIDRGLGRQA